VEEVVEQIASENYPEWKKHLDTTGKRLPRSVRKELETTLQEAINGAKQA
jgi:hypothetical protein